MEKKAVNLLALCDSGNVTTGFSKVSTSIFKFLPKADYDLRVIGVNYLGDPSPLPYPVFPANLGGDVYGVNRIGELTENWTPDIIFILNDAWIIKNYLVEIKKVFAKKVMPKIVLYTPVDAEDHDPKWYVDFPLASKIVTYTEFGKKVIEKAAPELMVDIIPHGVDHQDFFDITEVHPEVTRRMIKQELYPDREDFLDSFVVLNTARNQPRKKLDITIKAFAEFSKNKPENVKLYLHAGVQDNGHINILEMANRCGLGERIIVTNTENGPQHVPTALLNLIYNATDAGINTSLGEGWNLPCMEHSVTGAPQIVAGHSALKELYSDCGLLIPAKIPWTQDKIQTTGYLVTIEDTAQALETLYSDTILYNSCAYRCKTKFNQPMYDWSVISGQWDTLFKSIV
jgi:D-inositol-3-phosphate glycosyltransferase